VAAGVAIILAQTTTGDRNNRVLKSYAGKMQANKDGEIRGSETLLLLFDTGEVFLRGRKYLTPEIAGGWEGRVETE